MNDIICAISTPPGMGAIAVVRLSGEGSIALVDTFFESPINKKLVDQKPYTVHFGKIMHNASVLDEVLITVFHAPHSFTGEESIEIACHGSVYIQQKMIELLIHSGARMAEAGEFT
ncbi:MAG: tRNA uridine-5-carboxymethylaminomethyl(34) synthesis GTPase MnmE, partial [Dysgonamonadaceae bacterium]|nr:tRNA uridine-5-carboxymethylaminomethyl(34) synthesis GTPase MnmE [Dysgonamonadaceae bacterium]